MRPRSSVARHGKAGNQLQAVEDRSAEQICISNETVARRVQILKEQVIVGIPVTERYRRHRYDFVVADQDRSAEWSPDVEAALHDAYAPSEPAWSQHSAEQDRGD